MLIDEPATVLNRFGLVLDFFAFWLATPELLGEKRLIAIENRVEVWIEEVRANRKSFFSLLPPTLTVLFTYAGQANGEFRWIPSIPPNWPFLLLVGVGVTLALYLLSEATTWLLAKTLPILRNDSSIRRRSLLLAALLYMLGLSLQLIATYL